MQDLKPILRSSTAFDAPTTRSKSPVMTETARMQDTIVHNNCHHDRSEVVKGAWGREGIELRVYVSSMPPKMFPKLKAVAG